MVPFFISTKFSKIFRESTCTNIRFFISNIHLKVEKKSQKTGKESKRPKLFSDHKIDSVQRKGNFTKKFEGKSSNYCPRIDRRIWHFVVTNSGDVENEVKHLFGRRITH